MFPYFRELNYLRRLLKMTNKRNHKRQSRMNKMTNPINRKLNRVPRPRLNFDGTALNGFQYHDIEISLANKLSHVFLMDCSNEDITVAASTRLTSMSVSLSALTKFYNQFRYTACKLTWLPHVAPGVADGGSPCYIGYVTNPEDVVSAANNSNVSNLSIVKGARNMRTFNAWQAFTYNVPMDKRRPWFDVNTNEAINVDIYDRSVQGAVVFAAETLSAVADIGSWHAVYTIELKALNLNLTT
jgi:hypothetical protein